MPRRLTATERAEREKQRLLTLLRNELRRDLERDAKQLLTGLRQQLTEELQRAFSQTLSPSSNASTGTNFSSIGSLSRIVGSILRLTAKPRITTTQFETNRSQEALNSFQSSRGQSLADLNSEVGKGERNL